MPGSVAARRLARSRDAEHSVTRRSLERKTQPLERSEGSASGGHEPSAAIGVRAIGAAKPHRRTFMNLFGSSWSDGNRWGELGHAGPQIRYDARGLLAERSSSMIALAVLAHLQEEDQWLALRRAVSIPRMRPAPRTRHGSTSCGSAARQ